MIESVLSIINLKYKLIQRFIHYDSYRPFKSITSPNLSLFTTCIIFCPQNEVVSPIFSPIGLKSEDELYRRLEETQETTMVHWLDRFNRHNFQIFIYFSFSRDELQYATFVQQCYCPFSFYMSL